MAWIVVPHDNNSLIIQIGSLDLLQEFLDLFLLGVNQECLTAMAFNGIKSDSVAFKVIRIPDRYGAAFKAPQAHSVGTVLGACLIHKAQSNLILF